MGNPTQVNQIFMNLCTNAAQAMQDTGGILEIAIRDMMVDASAGHNEAGLAPGKYLRIDVSDTGIGIAPDIMESIFDPYFSTKKPGEGTGLGLAMVHGIIKSVRGKIFVKSQVGSGSVFTIYLPATSEEDSKPLFPDVSLPSGNEHILLVDDEEPVARMVSKSLSRLRYEIAVRTSSVEPLALMRKRPVQFDMLITAMTMPNMTGEKLALEVLKLRPGIPVILCTGFSNIISEKSAAAIGIKAFIYKPLSKTDLANTVRSVLDNSKEKADYRKQSSNPDLNPGPGDGNSIRCAFRVILPLNSLLRSYLELDCPRRKMQAPPVDGACGWLFLPELKLTPGLKF